jgi:hypothetical protein
LSGEERKALKKGPLRNSCSKKKRKKEIAVICLDCKSSREW